ncbi:MAG: diaminopimelate decarboxylase [Gammaproteobacteria bacterium]|nr:diaminopimelate decarboxylase [Gammaproteobacteria bacterium]MBU1414409.1 diaminopimelate decarboxylase [Gammaproteobacteria bacterium]
MTHFALRDGILHVENVALEDIAARFGTPCYVYSRATLADAYLAYRQALEGVNAQVCYAVKANSNLAILNLFADFGAGFDIVSGGELARVLVAGGDPGKILFSGVGKSRAEMEDGLEVGIRCFNIESASEMEKLNEVAHANGARAPVSLRVNPNIDAKTHPYISTGLRTTKFGVPIEDAHALYRRAAELPGLKITGIDCHIGSQLLDPAPAAEAAAKVVELADELAADGIMVEHLDLGGGMGISYREDKVPTVAEYLAPVLAVLKGRNEQLMFEPGRSMVGNAGLLLTRVETLKHGAEKNFAVVDAAMNDLMRPALYDAWHDIVKVSRGDTPSETQTYDIVGPICESGDFLGQARSLALAEGDLLAVMSAGAYGMAMSSNYNSRPRAAEVMVDGADIHLIRRREEVTELFAAESLLP